MMKRLLKTTLLLLSVSGGIASCSPQDDQVTPQSLEIESVTPDDGHDEDRKLRPTGDDDDRKPKTQVSGQAIATDDDNRPAKPGSKIGS